MIVYRIGKSTFGKDLTGEGARIFGGRWNQKGTPCIYTSSTKSLCILEYSANVPAIDLPPNPVITTLEIPDSSVLTRIGKLPLNWKKSPASFLTRDFGTRLLKKNKFLVIRIPSVIVTDEYNYIINPLHPRMREVKIVSVEKYAYDTRIKR